MAYNKIAVMVKQGTKHRKNTHTYVCTCTYAKTSTYLDSHLVSKQSFAEAVSQKGLEYTDIAFGYTLCLGGHSSYLHFAH